MSESLYLSADYVTINGSYGGNQAWFRDDIFGNGDLISIGGCGLIAMADSLLYLANQQQLSHPLPSVINGNKLTESTYKMFVESLFYRYLQPWRNPLFNPADYRNDASFVLGIQGWQLRRGFNRFFQQRQSRFYTANGRNNLSQLIQQQLLRDRPIPLMIGPTKEMFPKGLHFLGRTAAAEGQLIRQMSGGVPQTSGVVTSMSAHWVTVTGYYRQQRQEYVIVSSWGAPYVLDLTAYLAEREWIGGIVLF